MYKFKNLLLPVPIGNYFEIDRCAEEHNHLTRNQSMQSNVAPRIICRTKTAEKSVQSFGSKLWSELPSELKSCESLSIFKSHLKKYLLQPNEE